MIMNKAIFSVISAVMFFLFAPPSQANIILNITPDTQSLSVGSPVSFSINVSGLGSGTALGAYDLNIGFDSALLSFSQVIFGDQTLGDQLDLSHLGLNAPTATPSLGNVNLIEFSLDDPATLIAQQASSFTLATVSFTTLASGISPITLSVLGLTDANAIDIPNSTVNGSVTVASVPLPGTLWLLMSGGVTFLLTQRRRLV
jgi:hypothetical protein